MDAFPMIAQCMERQWMGLPELTRRCFLESDWCRQGDVLAVVTVVGQTETPIWSVINVDHEDIHLISIKEDSSNGN